MRSVEDRLDLAWGFYFRSIILRHGPSIVHVVLDVPVVNELLDLILKGDTLLNGVTGILVVPIIFVLVPLGAISAQRVRLLEYPSLLCSHKNVLW